jgi:hypothetical protein
MANKFGEKVTGSVAFSGVSGVDVVSLGSGTSDELRPCRPNSTRDDISLTQSWPANLPSYEQMYHENFNTASAGEDAGKISMPHKAKYYETGDLVVYYLTNTNLTSGAMPGLTVRTPYYAIRIDDQNIGLATTYANALAGTRITFDGDRSGINASNQTIVAVKHLCMIKNALFDYNNQYPVFGQWNANPNYTTITQTGNALNALNSNGAYNDWEQYLAQWRHYGAIQMPGNGWMSSAVQTFQQNDAPYKDSGVGTGNQARIISMGGPGTIYPLGTGIQIADGLLYSHVKDSYKSSVDQNTDLVGNANLWTMHQWQQDQFFVGTYMRAGGKIRFGAKIRVSEEDMIQDLNFGGLYVKLQYISDSNGPTANIFMRNHIESITVKKKDIDLGLPSGAIPTGNVSGHFSGGTFSNDGNTPKIGTTYTPSKNANHNMTVNHNYVNVEDHADFKEVVVEFDVPSDFVDSQITTHYQPFYVGVSGHNVTMTLAMQFSENGSYINNANNDNDREINASQISRNEPYTIIENKSGVNNSTMLTQDELHSIMATSADDYPIESSKMMQVGGIYTIVTTGSEIWNGIEADVFGKSDQNLVSDYDILNGDNAGVGFCFKVKSITGTLNGTGTVRRGGYHESMDILPKNTSTVAKGKFVRRSGSVQIYSPFLEYIAPDQP